MLVALLAAAYHLSPTTYHLSPIIYHISTITHRRQDPKAGRKLVFDDEFKNDPRVNTDVWMFHVGHGYNNEVEMYTPESGDNVATNGHTLVITARKDAEGNVTSGRLESKPSWKYGYFEVRAKIPTGHGTWPAIWLLPDSLRHPGSVQWPACGEIDVMENVGYEPNTFHFSLHCEEYNWKRKEQRTAMQDFPDANTKFHVFGLDWQPDTIVFYVDGQPTYTVNREGEGDDGWPYNKPFYIILNLAIGGDWGGAKGIDDSIFPSKFLVDYVRVYQ